MKDIHKSYFKKNIVLPITTPFESSSSTNKKCNTTPNPNDDILSKYYYVNDNNGNYDYSKVSKKIADLVKNNDNTSIDLLNHPRIQYSYPWDKEDIYNNDDIKMSKEPIKIYEINRILNKLIKYEKKTDIEIFDNDNLGNWYDFFTIPDYNIGNKFSYSNEESAKKYNYCPIGYIPSSSPKDGSQDKMLQRNVAQNGSYKNTFFYSPLALILLLGTSKDDLLNLYDKYTQKQWKDIYERLYNEINNNIKYDLIINNEDNKIEKNAYIGEIFNDKVDNINNLFNKYANNLTYKDIEPLYDKYSNNIYEKNIDILFYEKAYEIALKVSNYNNYNQEDKFYISIKTIHDQFKNNDIIDNIIEIIRISSYYCFGKITEKNLNLNRIYQNYNNYCLNKLNFNYNTNKKNKSTLDIDISKLSNTNTKRRKQNNIIDSIKQYKLSTSHEYVVISNSNSKILLENEIKNKNLKINLLNNSFFRTIQFYIKFFIFFIVTNLIVYLSFHLIENNWKSFTNVFNTLIFGLIIIMGSIWDYIMYANWNIPYTKRNVLYIHKTSLNLEYEIKKLQKKYAIIQNSKENNGGDLIVNIILGLAFLFIFKIIIEVIVNCTKLFNKNVKNSSFYNNDKPENIKKLLEYNDNDWWNYKKKSQNDDIINLIKLQLTYLQFMKLENSLTVEPKPNKKEITIAITFVLKFKIDLSKLVDGDNKFIEFQIKGTAEKLASKKQKKLLKDYNNWKKCTLEKLNDIFDNELYLIINKNKDSIYNEIKNIKDIFSISNNNYRDFEIISKKTYKDPEEIPTFLDKTIYIIKDRTITFETKEYQVWNNI